MVSEPIQGQSYFSTEGYQRPPRPAGFPPPPQILRTDVERDTAAFVANLRTKHPIICYGIFPGWDIRHFFDEYDHHQQGGEFLYNVILKIMKENEAHCIEYCHKWSEAHRTSLHQLLDIDDPQRLFHANDRAKWGARFLEKAYGCMKRAYLAAIEEEKGVAKREVNSSTPVGPPLSSKRRSSSTSQQSRSFSQGFVMPNRSYHMEMPQQLPHGFHGPLQETIVYAPGLIHEHPGLHIPSPHDLHQRGLEIMQIPADRQSRGAVRNGYAAHFEHPGVLGAPPEDQMFNGHVRPQVHYAPRRSSEDASLARMPSVRETWRSFNPSARSRGRGGYSSQHHASARRPSFSRPYYHQDESIPRVPWRANSNAKIHSSVRRRSTSVSSGADVPQAVPLHMTETQKATERERNQSRDKVVPEKTHNYMPHHVYPRPSPSNNAEPGSPWFIASNYIGPSVTEIPVLFVAGFGEDDAQALKQTFEPFFRVLHINIRLPVPGDNKKPYAFMRLMTIDDTRAALDTPVYTLAGRKLDVQVAMKCCSQPSTNGVASFVPGDSVGERRLSEPKENGDEQSNSNVTSTAPRVQRPPNTPPTFTPQDARSSLPRGSSPVRLQMDSAEPSAPKKLSPPKRKLSTKGKHAPRPLACLEATNAANKVNQDVYATHVKVREPPAQESVKPTWANVASKNSQSPTTEIRAEQFKPKRSIEPGAGKQQHVELIHAGRLEGQPMPEKREQLSKDPTDRSLKPAKPQRDSKAVTEKRRLAQSEQTAKEERLTPINEDPDESNAVQPISTSNQAGCDEGSTDGTAQYGHPALARGKIRNSPGKGPKKAASLKSHTLPPPSEPSAQELNTQKYEKQSEPDNVPDTSSIGQKDLYSSDELPVLTTGTTSPESEKESKAPLPQPVEDDYKAPISLPTEDKAFTRLHGEISNLISEFPLDAQAHWQSCVEDIKSSIDGEEAKFLKEAERYQSDLTSTQKKSIKKRMAKTKQRCQDGIDRLVMLQSEISNALQKFEHFKEGSVKPSTGRSTNILKISEGIPSVYQGPFFVLPGQDPAGVDAGRSVNEILIAKAKPKEASVGGSYALKGSAMAHATEAFGYRSALPRVRHESMTSQASASSRLSYATVAASQATPSTTGTTETMERAISNESISSTGDRTRIVPGQGKPREVSWGVGPEGAWGEKGLRGHCI